MKKIDLHVHAGLPPVIAVPADAAQKVPENQMNKFKQSPEWLRGMFDRMGIEKGVWLAGGASPECGNPNRMMSLREILAFFDANRELFAAWFCPMDPRMGRNAPTTDFSEMLNTYKSLGAKGISETSANIPLDDPRFLNFFEHCEACGMSVTLHFGVPNRGYGVVDDLHLPRLQKVLERCPKLTVIGHSPIWWNEIADNVTDDNREGYVTGAIEKEGVAVRIMRRHPNMHADLSAMSAYTAITRDPDYGYRFLEEFSDRLYFATDNVDQSEFKSPLPTLSAYLDRAVADGNISQKAYENICRKNALRLLQIDGE